MKLKSAKNLDARQAMLLEHAYFQVGDALLRLPCIEPLHATANLALHFTCVHRIILYGKCCNASAYVVRWSITALLLVLSIIHLELGLQQ